MKRTVQTGSALYGGTVQVSAFTQKFLRKMVFTGQRNRPRASVSTMRS